MNGICAIHKENACAYDVHMMSMGKRIRIMADRLASHAYAPTEALIPKWTIYLIFNGCQLPIMQLGGGSLLYFQGKLPTSTFIGLSFIITKF